MHTLVPSSCIIIISGTADVTSQLWKHCVELKCNGGGERNVQEDRFWYDLTRARAVDPLWFWIGVVVWARHVTGVRPQCCFSQYKTDNYGRTF